MTLPADVDTATGHISLVEILAEPLVSMAGFRDQVMEGNKMITATKHAGLIHHSTPS